MPGDEVVDLASRRPGQQWWKVTRRGVERFTLQARTRGEAFRLANVRLKDEGDADTDIDVEEMPGAP